MLPYFDLLERRDEEDQDDEEEDEEEQFIRTQDASNLAILSTINAMQDPKYVIPPENAYSLYDERITEERMRKNFPEGARWNSMFRFQYRYLNRW